MADSTPLLNNSASAHEPENPVPDVSIEQLIEPYIGDLTRPLIFQAMLVTMAAIFVGQQTFISIFSDAKPTWHCTQQAGVKESTSTDMSLGTIPPICNPRSNICHLPSDTWTWDKPGYTTIVSEWFLQCAGNSIIIGLPASSFFLGSLFGGIVIFFIGDSYGRKKVLFLSCFVMSMASFFTAFSNNVWIYSAGKFLIGYGCGQTGSCALVLATESVGKQWQGKVATMRFLTFTFGFATLPAIAYTYRSSSWRVLYLLTSIPAILYCLLLYFCAYESPRWLIAHGFEQEAVATLKTFSRQDIADLSKKLASATATANQGQNMINRKQSFKILFTTRGLFQQLLLAMLVAFGVGMMYYGLPLALGNLGSNSYLTVALNAFVDVPATLLTFYAASKLKRRTSLLAFSILSGACGIVLCFMAKWKVIQVGLELASFFSACTHVTLLLIYATELFPTYVRNTAVSMVFQALALAGIFSPVLIAGIGDINEVLPYGVFGVLIITTGSLVMFLPETLGGATLADNKDEQAGKSCLA